MAHLAAGKDPPSKPARRGGTEVTASQMVDITMAVPLGVVAAVAAAVPLGVVRAAVATARIIIIITIITTTTITAARACSSRLKATPARAMAWARIPVDLASTCMAAAADAADAVAVEVDDLVVEVKSHPLASGAQCMRAGLRRLAPARPRA